MRLIESIIIAGHEYSVMVDGQGKVVQTACKGRWAMSDCATGDNWLDAQLQRAVDDRLDD